MIRSFCLLHFRLRYIHFRLRCSCFCLLRLCCNCFLSNLNLRHCCMICMWQMILMFRKCCSYRLRQISLLNCLCCLKLVCGNWSSLPVCGRLLTSGLSRLLSALLIPCWTFFVMNLWLQMSCLQHLRMTCGWFLSLWICLLLKMFRL